MFRTLAAQLTDPNGKDDAEKKTLSPTLRSDIYTAMDKTTAWLASSAGDGMSYGALLQIIQKHFPMVKMPVEALGRLTAEVTIIIGSVTNMILEMSQWEGMTAAMMIGRWVGALGAGFDAASLTRKSDIARGITTGVAQNADAALVAGCKEFAAKIQIISSLKSLASKVYPVGSSECRQAEASISSKFM